jgi:hypothetical protein
VTEPRPKENHTIFLLTVGLLAWLIPGAGHLMIKENKRAFIISVTIILTFCAGLYVGSIGIINPSSGGPGVPGQNGRLCRLWKTERNRTDIYQHRGFA